ncbi:MAG: Flp pilus assembly protein CpaB [Gemmataceae bacterium]
MKRHSLASSLLILCLAASGKSAESVKVLVAREDVPARTVISDPAKYFETRSFPKAKLSRNYIAADSRSELRGKIIICRIRKGEVVAWEDCRPEYADDLEAVLPAGRRGFPFEVTPETAAGGFVLPGTHVDVIHIKKNEDGSVSASYVWENALVRAVNQQLLRGDDCAGVDCKNVTLELTPEGVLRFAKLAESGTFKLALRPRRETGGKPPPRADRPKFDVRTEEGKVAALVSRGDLSQWTPLDDPKAMFEVAILGKNEVPDDYVPAGEFANRNYPTLRRKLPKGSVLTYYHLLDRQAVSLEAILPWGKRAFAVKATPESAGNALPGSHVDVVLTKQGKVGAAAMYVLEDVLVRGVDQESLRPADGSKVEFKTVTLEVTPEEALKLAQVVDTGAIRLIMRPFGDKRKHSESVKEAPPPPPPPPE